MRKIALLLGLLLVGGTTAHAASSFVTIGYGRGGDALADVTGGQNYNTHAGDGLALLGGFIFPVSPTEPHRFEAELAVGYLFQGDARDVGNETSWRRFPIEATYFYRNTTERFRFGWGATYHVANRISASGVNATATTSAENALGWFVTAEKLFVNADASPGFWGIGLRYTSIKYRFGDFSRTVDGSTIWLTLSAAIL